MESVQEVNALPDEYPWLNFGLRPPVMKEIQIIRPTQIHGVPLNVGDITKVTERDALTMIACGKAMSYPPPQIQGNLVVLKRLGDEAGRFTRHVLDYENSHSGLARTA